MKKLYALAAIPLLAFGVGYAAHQPQTKEVKQTVNKTVQVAGPIYHVGDSQGGIRLEAVYAPATLTNTMGHGLGTSQMLVAVRLNADRQDLMNQSLIYTSDGQYIKPNTGAEVAGECWDCITFTAPSNALVDSFIYKDFIWQL